MQQDSGQNNHQTNSQPAQETANSGLTRMTGLLTRHVFHHSGTELMQTHPELKYAMLVMDIANFKSVNVFCDRKKGDEMLLYISDYLKGYWNDLTLVSHFRADTFALLRPFEDKQELIDTALALHAYVDAFPLPFKVLPSIGICIRPTPDTPANNMCDYATMALKEIKGKFYAKYNFFDERMFQDLLQEKQIENEILHALESNQLRPYIQPKVDMRTKEIIGGEALVRWIHPVQGVISPGQFIPVLEKNGLIINVDFHVWEQIFRWLGERVKVGKPVVPISINISRMHAYDNTFQEKLIGLSKMYEVPASLILLELTESAFLSDANSVYQNMVKLKEHGFTLSMDDFGTGYSTMTMLKDQPVDEVKVDKGFIDNIENENVQIILDNVISMLRSLKKTIMVEGVESASQQKYLLERNCNFAQGFLYYKPMPITDFDALLDP